MRRVDGRCGTAPRRVHAQLTLDVTDVGAHASRIHANQGASSRLWLGSISIGPSSEGITLGDRRG
jgi:hypothetical protein